MTDIYKIYSFPAGNLINIHMINSIQNSCRLWPLDGNLYSFRKLQCCAAVSFLAPSLHSQKHMALQLFEVTRRLVKVFLFYPNPNLVLK